MNDLILRAILSMDSYNRGYGEGIILAGTSIGGFNLGMSSTDVLTDLGSGLIN